MTEKLGFIVIESPDGEPYYGLHINADPRYIEFYEWAYARSYQCVNENFPWDYFVFNDDDDRDEFLSIYAEDFIE